MSEIPNGANDSFVPSPEYKTTVANLLRALFAGVQFMPTDGDRDDFVRRDRVWSSGVANYMAADVFMTDGAGSLVLPGALNVFLRRTLVSEEGILEFRMYSYEPFQGELQVANLPMSVQQAGKFGGDEAVVLATELLRGDVYTPSDEEYADFLDDLKSFEEQ